MGRRAFLTHSTMATAATAAVAGLGLTGTSNAADPQAVGGKEFFGKNALITGGARGIGFATAKALAKAGANVVIYDIASQIDKLPYALASKDDLAKAKSEIEAMGVKCIAIQGDVRNSALLKSSVARMVRELGSIDIVFANAGITQLGMIEMLKDEDVDLIMDINLKGVIKTVQAAIPHMKKQKSGRMVLNASITGRSAGRGFPIYSTTKWGVIGFCKNVALELAPYNVTCNAVCPSLVNTKLLDNPYVLKGLFPENPTMEQFHQVARARLHALPVGLYEPSVVADTVKFLCSEGAKYTSGDVFDIQAGANVNSPA